MTNVQPCSDAPANEAPDPVAVTEPNPDRTSAKFLAASTPPEWLVAEGASVLIEALDLLERAEELARRFDDLDFASMRIRPKLTFAEGDDAAGQEWSDAVFVWPAMRVLSAAASRLMPIAGHERPPKYETPSARTLRAELHDDVQRAADLAPIPFVPTRSADDLSFSDPDGNILMQQSTVDEGDGRHLVAMLPGDCMQGPDLEWVRKAGS